MARTKNIKRSDGRLQSKIYLGDGKYKYVYAETQKELDRKIQEVKLKIGKGIDISAERDTFGVWAERWLRKKKGKVSDGRYQTYAIRVKKMDAICHIPISELSVSDCQDIIDQYTAEGSAYKTLKEYKSVMSQICQYAIVNRVMDFNPIQGVELPPDYMQNDEDNEPRRALTEEEQKWILTPTTHRAHTAAMIMLFAGLRRGELLALNWTDINTKKRTITINKAVSMVKDVPKIKQCTKTKSGMRTVNIPPILAEYLEQQRSKSKTMLVCPNTKGQLMSGSSWRKLWSSYLKELNFRFGDFDGLLITDKEGHIKEFKKPMSLKAPEKIPMVIPQITAHWLRHTFITNMYLAGVDVLTAKEQAGHADITTTMEIYTHLNASHKTEQMDKLNDYYNKLWVSNGCQKCN
ncbi:MAG: site-specific integrase [Oscillospiraceae bacterium]|nr:site-specific integrase [Oscillospiraceae bacterium]